MDVLHPDAERLGRDLRHACGVALALRAGGASGAGQTLRPLRAGSPVRAVCAVFAIRAVRAVFPVRAVRTSGAVRALRACRTGGADRPGGFS